MADDVKRQFAELFSTIERQNIEYVTKRLDHHRGISWRCQPNELDVRYLRGLLTIINGRALNANT